MMMMSRKEIEENSPSRRDGMDSKKESQLRRSYCRFLDELGMLFKFPQGTITTAIILCHRFFLCNSLLKHDSRIIAAACMFVASKAEESRCDLKDVVITSYKIIHNKDSEQERSRICKDKVLYEGHEKAILDAEIAVLETLGFELDVAHPYNPLVEGIKRLFKVGDQRIVAQVALTLVNDALRTSLIFLQFEARHVAAGAIFLAAKLLKLEPAIPWPEFDDLCQMDDVSNQLLELYDRVPVAEENVGSSCIQAPKPTVQDNVGWSKQPPRTDEAPKPSSLKRKAGDSPDQLAVRKQQRVEYLSEDRRPDRDYTRHVQQNHDRSYARGHAYDRSYDRGRWYPSRHRRVEDDRSWRRGGHREYNRERVCGH